MLDWVLRLQRWKTKMKPNQPTVPALGICYQVGKRHVSWQLSHHMTGALRERLVGSEDSTRPFTTRGVFTKAFWTR